MNRPLRIAMGTSYPFDETRIRGGVEAVALSLTRALAKRPDVELHVISYTTQIRQPKTETRDTVVHHWLPTGARLHGLRPLTINLPTVRKMYRDIAPDIIHAQGFSEYAIGAPRLVPMVLTVHGVERFVPVMQSLERYTGLVGAYRWWVEKQVARASLSRADAMISIAGDYIPNILKDNLGSLLRDKPVFMIANPVGEEFFSGMDARVDQLSPAASIVLCVGEICHRKNGVDLIRIFSQVVKQLPGAQLRFAGGISEPRYHQELVTEIQQLGLQPSVQFLGRLDQTQLIEEYAACSVVVLPSLQETAPMALAQAMALGKPVVATRIGGVPAMVEDGVTGYLVHVGESQSMAAYLLELLTNHQRRNNMGKEGRKVAQTRFAGAIVGNQTMDAYRSVLGQAATTYRAGT